MAQLTAVLYGHKMKTLPCKLTRKGNRGNQEWRLWIHCDSDKWRKKAKKQVAIHTDMETQDACPPAAWTFPCKLRRQGSLSIHTLNLHVTSSGYFLHFSFPSSFIEPISSTLNIWRVARYRFDLDTSRPWNLYNLCFNEILPEPQISPSHLTAS